MYKKHTLYKSLRSLTSPPDIGWSIPWFFVPRPVPAPDHPIFINIWWPLFDSSINSFGLAKLLPLKNRAYYSVCRVYIEGRNTRLFQGNNTYKKLGGVTERSRSRLTFRSLERLSFSPRSRSRSRSLSRGGERRGERLLLLYRLLRPLSLLRLGVARTGDRDRDLERVLDLRGERERLRLFDLKFNLNI